MARLELTRSAEAPSTASAAPAPAPAPLPRILRNATLLVLAQAAAAPLSVLVNAVAARTLGTSSFGRLYQASTFAGFVFLFVEWGQGNVLMAKVARQRAAAGELLGSGIAFRVSAGLLAASVVPFACVLLGYDRDFLIMMEWMIVCGIFANISGACQDVFRGFERMDFAAASYVGWQLLTAAVVVPTLLLGAGVRGLLIAQTACAAVGAAFVLTMVPRMQVPSLTVSLPAIKDLVRSGRVFLLFALVLTLQPLIDAAMLSKFSAPEGLGWYAAARRLVGVLCYPAAALVIALYPTLSRLHLEDMNAFRKTAADAFHAVAIVVAPVSLGCALFPDLGVAIFGERYFGPAEQDPARARSLHFSRVFQHAHRLLPRILGPPARVDRAAIRMRRGERLCDPALIRWFQVHDGNGGLGVCVASVASEILMVIGGVCLMPAGILEQIPRRKLWSALLFGCGPGAGRARARQGDGDRPPRCSRCSRMRSASSGRAGSASCRYALCRVRCARADRDLAAAARRYEIPRKSGGRS